MINNENVKRPSQRMTPPSSQSLVYVIVSIGIIGLMITSFPSVAFIASAQYNNNNNNAGALPEKADITYSKAISKQQEKCLEITTDKKIYEKGDVIKITVRNTGDEPLEFPNSVLGLEIKNLRTKEIYPLISLQVITTLQPGESRTFEFTYDELVREIGTGPTKASVSVVGGKCSASTVFILK
jgi:hypothetical protein